MAIDPKIGDIVHIKGVVERIVQNSPSPGYEGLIGVRCRSEGEKKVYLDTVFVHRDAIIHIELAPLKVGDRVKWRDNGGTGIIIAINATCSPTTAWIRDQNSPAVGGSYGFVVVLDELERA